MVSKCMFSVFLLTVHVFVCLGQNVQFRIHEGILPGSFVGNIVEATSLPQQTLEYFLMNPDTDYESYFSMDGLAGNLTTRYTIDRESLCEFMTACELVLEVGGHSTANDGYFTVIRVLVIVEDINDNAPLFPDAMVHLPITEAVLTGATFTLEGARDRDTSPQYSLNMYELIPKYTNQHLPFDMSFSKNLDGSSTVKLKVTRHLDREVKASYEMYIVAKDGGSPPLNGSLYVNITIEDVNDNYPQFERPSYNVTINEDVSINTVILNLTAFDLDEGVNAEVTYSTSPHQPSVNLDTFILESLTGELRVTKPLSYNTQTSYKLIIEATDNGNVPLTTQTFVHVYVLNTGNNPPEIYVTTLPSMDLAEVSEYANLGAVVAHVAIVDHDAGRNGDVNCTLSHSKFGLQRYDVNEYKVILVETLDREHIPFHTVSVTCRYKKNPSLNSTTSFKVSVIDENDNVPTFKQQRYFTVITENNVIGESLATVSAHDLDTGNNSYVLYSVAPLSAQYALVNPNTGVVKANTRFNKEGQEGSGLSLTIYAIDHGTPQLTGTTTVLVSIRDVNDEGPVFVQSHFVFRIAENRPSDSFVGRLRASDNDTSVNANTKFSLRNIAENLPFVVFLDGTIKTDRELDREFKSEYTFQVKAVDSGNSSLRSEALVTVIIEDVNDNPPVIHSPLPGNNTVYVPVTMPLHSTIFSVKATDRDDTQTSNGKLTFSISTPNSTNLFTIHSASGEIFISVPLSNPDLINKMFVLIIRVKDNGQTSKTVTATLHITITSGNSTSLTLPNDEYEKNVLIVIVVASVTLFISVGILVTIFVLRRIDTQMKDASARLKVLSENMYYRGTDKVDDLSELPLDEMGYTEKSKKEVSFSLEEDYVLADGVFQHHNSLQHILLEPPVQYKYGGVTPVKLDDSHSDMSRDSAGDSGKGGSDEESQREDSSRYRCAIPQKRNKFPGPIPVSKSRHQSAIEAPLQEVTSFHQLSPITTYSIPPYHVDNQQTSSSHQSKDHSRNLEQIDPRHGKITMNLQRDCLQQDYVV